MYSDHLLDLSRIKLIPKADMANGPTKLGTGKDTNVAAPGSVDALPKNMKWLMNNVTNAIKVVSGWDKSQTIHDPKVATHHFGATCGFCSTMSCHKCQSTQRKR